MGPGLSLRSGPFPFLGTLLLGCLGLLSGDLGLSLSGKLFKSYGLLLGFVVRCQEGSAVGARELCDDRQLRRDSYARACFRGP